MSNPPMGQHDCAQFRRYGLAEALQADANLSAWGACSSCRQHVITARSMVPVLKQRPMMPTELAEPEFAHRVMERIILRVRQAETGSLLDEAMQVPPPVPAQSLHPGLVLRDTLTQAVRSSPQAPSDEAWSRLRSKVWQQVRQVDSAGSAPTARLALAGLAAAAVFMTFLLQERNTVVPTIVFTDVASIPGSELSPMSILRGR